MCASKQVRVVVDSATKLIVEPRLQPHVKEHRRSAAVRYWQAVTATGHRLRTWRCVTENRESQKCGYWPRNSSIAAFTVSALRNGLVEWVCAGRNQCLQIDLDEVALHHAPGKA